MSSPAEFYKSLPPISKAYGTACLLFTVACQFGLCHPVDIALFYELVFSNFQIFKNYCTVGKETRSNGSISKFSGRNLCNRQELLKLSGARENWT